MNRRPLGRTGIEVSEIGYGAWGLGQKQWIGARDEDSLAALERAFDLGVTFVDTALAYGDGHSEQVVGQAVRKRGGITVATKIYPKNREWPARRDVPVREVFPSEHVISCTERSLRNLGVEAIDLQQLHVWTDEFVGQGDWLEAVEKLKQQGKIRHFGVSLAEHQPENGLALLETGAVDTVQVVYNIFDPTPADALFPACRRLGIGVIARVPFDEGGLTGRVTPETVFPEEDFRNHYFAGDRKREVWERVQAIAADLMIRVEGMPEKALRFVLSHPDVSTVIPGMRSIRNVERNCRAGDGRGLPDSELSTLRAHRWPRNFYQ